ncbi:AAA family ATPase [Enhygromyxa salina]|uniref:histidine kinase n=1 Tax=Enhygromyxa salina TaxID=215803 RepID=A0A2S9YLR6_9BACT|nr:AAA family ATPase [Enhygromyxa salina]PRQ05982.1 Wide host range VirA protein [Enhygromyxa salina]
MRHEPRTAGPSGTPTELSLTGYTDARLLRAAGQSRIYEAVRRSDRRPVIAKVFDLGGEDLEARVEHEFALLRGLDVEGVVRALELQRVGEQLVLLLDRSPGVNLAVHCGGRALPVANFMTIAVQLATILERIHECRIIHRDIKPTNILIDPATQGVQIADFGISVLLEGERRHIYDPAVLEGTLPYISPEQTGRTGRPVDFRSDLYSLGVTFYELLTGRRPFEYAAPLELIHAHLARVPVSPATHRPGLPDGLVRLVLELLAKAPEHRYQTAAGLAADLRRLDRLLAAGDEGVGFVLGTEDTSRELQLPHQLYGRAAEREALAAELELVTQADSARLLLVSGPGGIGKSALISDFDVAVAAYGSYVGRGKFDRDRPYSGFVQALASLVEQLLTESEARLERWRDRLAAALGGLGSAVVELVPILALIVGEQPAAPSLEPVEARNRVHFGLARFLSVFCREGRPLVLVLEDLQWADNSSLALLEALLDGGRHGSMLLVGSVRTGEAGHTPALDRLVMKLPDERGRVVELGPLSRPAVEQLLADALARPAAELGSLVELVVRKTDNNPLFIRQLLTHLYEAGLMRAGVDGGWSYDDDAIEAAGIPDNALELMAAKLAALPEHARELLQRAACIGDSFELATVELICDRSGVQLAATLYDLVAAGLIDHVRGEYRFAHQGIRELASLEAGLELRQRLRWRIGQHLLGKLDAGVGVGDKLFEVVDHLDAGLAGAGELDASARLRLAELNLRAGRRALDSAAYEPALRYLEHGLGLVTDEREVVARDGLNAPHYQTIVELTFARAQVLAACGRAELAERAFESLLDWRLESRDHARAAASWVAHLRLCGRNAEAEQLGRAALARHGCTIEPAITPASARAQLERAWRSVRDLELEQLMAMPPCTDERAFAVMEILTPTKTAAYVTDPNAYVVLICTQLQWLLRYGVCPGASLGIAQLAICVGSMLGEVEGAIRASQLAIALAEQVDSRPTQVQVDSVSQLFVAHLGRPFIEPLSRMDAAFVRALEVGDFLWAGYTGAVALSMNLEVGTHLQVLGRLCDRFEQQLGARASAEACVVASNLSALGVVLGGRASDAELDQARARLQPEPIEAGAGSRYSLYVTIANGAMVSVVLGEHDNALRACLRIIDTVERVLFGSWMIPRVALTAIIAAQAVRAAGQPTASAGERALEIVREWAANCEDNYAHYLDLAEGLLADDASRIAAALERARAHAHERGCRWVEGLAAEQLAALADRDGLTGFAAGARRQAWSAYAAWGAGAKLEQLRASHPEEFAVPLAREAGVTRSSSSPLAPGTSSSDRERRSRAGALDFDSVLRSVAAIRADLRLDQVTAAVLEVAITNAGADHGMLVLEHGGVFGIVAESALDSAVPARARPLALDLAGDQAPTSLINYVLRTGKDVVLEDASDDPRFGEDPYVAQRGVLSLLGMPIVQSKRTRGVLVLENRLSRSCFTPDRLDVLQLICGQAAGALEHARVHDALREGEARWRSLVDGAPDLIALIDEDGEVEFVNRSGMSGAGASATDSDPRHRMPELFAGSSAAARWRAAVDAVLLEGTIQELEIEVPREVGPARWYTARLAPIELQASGGFEQRTHRKAIAIATDISARKQAEADKRALEAQLRQQQRLESIGTLASGVAHEINNPIQGIMNYAELISSNVDQAALVQEFASEIVCESERVATIVRNLLAFSRHEGLQPIADTDLGVLVARTLSLIHSIVHKDHIKLRVAIPPGLPLVRCRGQQIQQIVMNLVTNARDALNSVGRDGDREKWIEIRGEELERPEHAPGGTWVRLTVEDLGPGIPADILPRIFDPFFTTKGRDQGTGLGLAVSHGIARDHGGELSVDSAPGRGTRFYLDLPAGEPGAGASSS